MALFGIVWELGFLLMFLLVFTVFGMALVRSIRQGRKNDRSPRLTVDATVVAKRTEVYRHHDNDLHQSATRYYATFQVASGDRMELPLSGQEYGMLVEGDQGNLTFQGTRYLDFQRN